MNMGERFAMPVYPAAMSTLALPTTGPARWDHTRHAASALAFASAGLALIASFLPLYSTTLTITAFGNDDSDAIVATATSWGMEFTGGPGPAIPETSAVPMNGYPLVVACFVLIAAAVVSWFAATPGAPPGTHRTSAMSVSIGAAFLLGTVWTVALQSIATIESVAQLSEPADGFNVTATYGVGHWLLLTAALISIAAAVLALIPARDRTWTPIPTAVDPNMATPPFGFVLPPDGGVQTPHTTVDPLTGLPTQIDPLTGQPAMPYTQSPPTGFQASPPPIAPNTGLPLTGPPRGAFAAPQPPIDPNTGLPSGTSAASQPPIDPNTGLSSGVPAGQPPIDPNTGLPAAQPPIDPNTGLPYVSSSSGMPTAQSPHTGPPGGVPALAQLTDPLTGLPHPTPPSVPSSATPSDGPPLTDPAPGMPILGPIVIPDPPPAPEQPPGPAIPPTEDPLAEPRRD